MKILQSFILTIMESSSILILWSAINKDKNNKIIKNIVICIIASIITFFTRDLNIYISQLFVAYIAMQVHFQQENFECFCGDMPIFGSWPHYSIDLHDSYIVDIQVY